MIINRVWTVNLSLQTDKGEDKMRGRLLFHNGLLRTFGKFMPLPLLVILLLITIPQNVESQTQSTLQCDPQIYYGVQHCTDESGDIHIVTADLRDPHVRFETVLSSRNGVECNSVNPWDKDSTSNCTWPYPFESVKSMLERYTSQGAVAAINTDYFGSQCDPRCNDHGAQGLAVKNGVRFDGLEHGVSNNIAVTSPSLAISPSNNVTIGFPDSQDQIGNNLDSTYYNTVGGAPIIIGGQAYGNDACNPGGVYVYPGQTCTDTNQSAAGITNYGNLVLITAKRDATGVADYLSTNYQVSTALKFDGGTSSSIAWLDANGNTQDYHPKVSDSPIVAEALVIFSEKIPTSQNVDVTLIIDSSGSMQSNDSANKRLQAARAYLTASLDGDFVGVVDFDSSVRLASPLLRLPDDKEELIGAINTIDSSGGTNIGVGVEAACYALINSSSPNSIKGAILLTDGQGSFLDQDSCFKARGWPIYTFGFGSANDALLQQIASNTGGVFARLPTSDLICEFQRVRSAIAGVDPLPCTTYHIGPLEITILTITVPTGQEQVTYSISWVGSDVEMSLVSPSGRTINRDTIAEDVIHDLGSSFEVYTILNPEPGDWKVSLFGADVPPEGEDVVFGFTNIPKSNQPPVCSDAIPSVETLWPVNHEFIPINILGIKDPEGDTISIVIDSIYQDEPVDAPGSGSTSPDGKGINTETAYVRAERMGSENGRFYHIYFTAGDDHGGTCSGEVLVGVPKSQGNKGVPIDDGPLYDSTAP